MAASQLASVTKKVRMNPKECKKAPQKALFWDALPPWRQIG
jgi:hypothetical protein